MKAFSFLYKTSLGFRGYPIYIYMNFRTLTFVLRFCSYRRKPHHDSNTGTTPNGTSDGTAAGRGRDYQQTPPVHGSKAGENTIAGASYHRGGAGEAAQPPPSLKAGTGSRPNGRRPGVVLGVSVRISSPRGLLAFCVGRSGAGAGKRLVATKLFGANEEARNDHDA